MKSLATKLVAATALVTVTWVSAQAADLPMVAPAEAPLVPAYSWSGFFIGVHGGALFADGERGDRFGDLCRDDFKKGDIGKDGALNRLFPRTKKKEREEDLVSALYLGDHYEHREPRFDPEKDIVEEHVQYCEIAEDGRFDRTVGLEENERITAGQAAQLGRNSDFFVLDSGRTTNSNDDGDVSGLVGAQVGYNWQFGSFVVGVEADASYTGFGDDEEEDDRATFRIFDTRVPAGSVETRGGLQPPRDTLFGQEGVGTIEGLGDTVEMEWLSTVRGRLGVAFDRFMLYGTGGLAISEFDRSSVRGSFQSVDGQGRPTGAITNFGGEGDTSNVELGYAVGGGIEAMITPNVTARIEYLYVNFDFDESEESFRIGQRTISFDQADSFDAHIVRGALNFKFAGL